MKIVTADPESHLDYEFEFAGDLPDGDAITSQTVVADDPDVTVSNIGRTGTRIVAWTTGGTVGTTVQLKCTAVTTGGRTFVRRTSILLRHL